MGKKWRLAANTAIQQIFFLSFVFPSFSVKICGWGGAVVFCANLHRLIRFLPAIFFSKKTHRTCRKFTPLFASKPVGSNFPGHGHPLSHTKTKKFTWEVVLARGPNRGATPSGTSTNSLYRAVLSRRSHRVIMPRFATPGILFE